MKPKSPLLTSALFLVNFASAQVIQVEPNDSIATATPSTLVAGTSGGVFSNGNNGDGPFGPTTGDSTGDFDFFAIPAETGQVIVIDVNANINGSGLDSFIALYDDFGNLITSNDDDGTSRDSFISFTATGTRTYNAVVASWVPGPENIPAESLPSDPNTAGTGQGVPGGAVDDYEVVILLDGSSYLTHTQPDFPLADPLEVSDGTITLTNVGLEETIITALNITGEGASAYAFTQNLPLTIPASGSATINLTFTPGGSLETFQAALEVVSNDIIRPTLSVPLSERSVEGLVFRLPFDDPAESVVGAGVPAEVAGNGFPAGFGVNAGAPDPIFGRPPLAGNEGFSAFLNDDGRSGNFVFTNNNFPHPATFTYSLWVRPTAGTADDVLFNRNGSFSQQDTIYGCSITPDGTVRFRINNVEVVASASGAAPDDEAHHIVVTHLDSTGFGDSTADRTRLYIDGVMVAENTGTLEVPEYPFNSVNSRLWIGTRSAAGQGFNGDLDEFQFYNIELDGAQVGRLFSDPTTPIGSGPPARPAITNIIRLENREEVVITFDSIPGLTYNLEISTDLTDWSEYSDGIESQGASTTVIAPQISADATEFFFRIAVAP